jgi:hypothetical protein
MSCESPFPADISKVQDDEVEDGTTSVVVLAGVLSCFFNLFQAFRPPGLHRVW